jgi:uncharacterized membrane protein
MQDKGFFTKIFDLTFSEFVTVKIIKVLFIIGIILATLGALGFLISSFATGKFFAIIMGLILSPIIWIVYVIMIRVWLEIIIVIFRIAENTTELVQLKKSELGK